MSLLLLLLLLLKDTSDLVVVVLLSLLLLLMLLLLFRERMFRFSCEELDVPPPGMSGVLGLSLLLLLGSFSLLFVILKFLEFKNLSFSTMRI
jgi:hypothetical protein